MLAAWRIEGYLAGLVEQTISHLSFKVRKDFIQ